MTSIEIHVADIAVRATLNDSPTAREIYRALPFSGTANRWGEEIYFQIPLALKLEAGAQETVEVGDLAYWPSGPAFCIFFGPTPVSTDDRPRAYSAVNVFGRLDAVAEALRSVADGVAVVVMAAD